MPLILAIETSSRRCSVALGDGHFLVERLADRPREHHALVLPMLAELLHECGVGSHAIELIAFGRGPGSFTGARIATAFAQGLGFALQRPLVPVSSLEALALAAHRAPEAPAVAREIVVAVDAHMGELFLARYRREATGLVAVSTDLLARVEGFCLPQDLDPAQALLAGDAWTVYPDIRPRTACVLEDAWPRARAVLELALAIGPARQVAAREAEPVYVRGASVWKTRREQSAVSGGER
jgi:tRNA threonylcarbamoyladenosine biosynthesis protein TsaB